MSIAVAIGNLSYWSDGKRILCHGTLTPSGNYPANGDIIDFTGLLPASAGPGIMIIENPTGFPIRLSQTSIGNPNDNKLLLFSPTAGAASVAATDTLTSNNTQVTDGDTVTINGVVYTFKATIGTAARNVHLVTNADTSLGNLAKAIMQNGVAGTDYTAATTVDPNVTSSVVSAHAITLTAKIAGTGGNALTLATTAVTLTPGAATFAGGTNQTASADAGAQLWPTSTAIPFFAEFQQMI